MLVLSEDEAQRAAEQARGPEILEVVFVSPKDRQIDIGSEKDT